LTVQNTGGGTISGTVTVSAPFSVVSGGSFTLAGAGTTQAVTVRFTPTTAATATANVDFTATDGGRVSRVAVGTGVPKDTTPPTVAVTSPTRTGTYTTISTSLTAAGTAVDDVGVTQVTWANDRGGTGTASGTTSWTVAGITLRPGTNIVTITARDAAGNAGTSTLTVTCTAPDTTPPTLAILTPASATYLTASGALAITGTASDDIEVTQVTWTNDRGGAGVATGTTSWTADGIVLQPGTNVVTVSAQDAAGNNAARTLTVTYDATAPDVAITAPTAGTTVAGTVTVTATATDDVGVAGVQLLVDGAPTGTEMTTPPYAVVWNAAATPNGSHTLSAQARDLAGNTTLSATVVVTVANATPPGLVAAYAFNEGTGTTVWDASGNNNTGTLRRATWTTAGKFGPALVFNGAARVTVADSPSLRLTTGMTLEAWVKPSTVTAAWRDVIYKGNDNYYLEATSDSNGVPGAGGTFGHTLGTGALPVNVWTHLAATYDRVAVRLYVNGALVSSLARTAAITTSVNPLEIGGDSIFGQFFQGVIDEVRIYNRPLSPAEIQSDMTLAVPGRPDTTRPAVTITTPTRSASYVTATSVLTVGGTASDNVGVAQVTWSNDRGGTGTATGTTSWKAAGIVLLPGTNVITVTARDAAGNSGSSTLTVTYDSAAPTVSITEPLTATVVSSTVTVTATATDDIGVAGVQFLVDGALLATEITTSPYTIAWNTALVTNGPHVLSARARDSAGNTTSSADVLVTVDNAGPSGLVAAYAFDEGTGTTVADSSGNDNTGTLGTGVTWTVGRFGSALAFDGGARVTINDSPSLHLTDALTLEAWVKPSAVTAAWRDVIYKGNDNYYLEATSDSAGVPGAGGTFGTTYGTAPLPANEWTHLALTYDRVEVRLYVNGALVSSVPRTTAIATSTNPLELGGDSIFGQYFEGAIDEVRIYNRALSALEIQSDMNAAVAPR
jgi:hypothetical protein